MGEYVAKVLLDVNGQQISDFKSVSESEVDIRKQVPLMNKTGHVNVTPRYQCVVEYVVPSDSPEFDWASVEGGTLTIDKNNGVRVTFSGVSTLKIGEAKADGENEITRSITLGAEDKIEQ